MGIRAAMCTDPFYISAVIRTLNPLGKQIGALMSDSVCVSMKKLLQIGEHRASNVVFSAQALPVSMIIITGKISEKP